MKTFHLKLFLTAVCLMVVCPGIDLRAEGKTVLDYYRLLDQSMLTGSKFSFYREKGVWGARSPGTDAELAPLIDIAGGYIKVSDPGTGGGTYTQETALFITGAGAVYIGVNEITFNGAYFDRAIHFYRYDGKKLVPADSVLPVIDAKMYFKSGYNVSPVAGKIHFEYSLPRKGTTVAVAIDTMLLERAASSGEFPPEAEQQSREALKNIIFKKIELNWDMDKGKFTIGKKRP